MRCYICDYHADPDDVLSKHNFKVDPDGKEVCAVCVRESKKYWNYLGSEGVSNEGSNIGYQVDLLEKRIPGLFCGPSCPYDGVRDCKCTYKSGCKMLVDKPTTSG